MSIFGEQLQKRIKLNNRLVDENMRILADQVKGRKDRYYSGETSSEVTIRQVERILQFMHLPVPENPALTDDLNQQIENVIEPSGATKRQVELKDRWWKDGDGPLLAVEKESGMVHALIPNKTRGYYYYDPETGEKKKINAKNQGIFRKDAWCFYKPLPPKPLTGRDYIRFLLKQIQIEDLLLVLLSVLFLTLFGTLTPLITNIGFAYLAPSGLVNLLIPLALLLLSASLGRWFMSIVKTSVIDRMCSRMDVAAQNAVYSRVLHLPAHFFYGESSGGIAEKVMILTQIPQLMADILFGGFLIAVMSIIYVAQLFYIAQPLVGPVFVIYAEEIAVLVITIIQERKIVRLQLAGSQENSGVVYSFISGIQKIKISNSEDRAFGKWMKSYAAKAGPAYANYFPYVLRMPLLVLIQMLGTLWIYVIAYKTSLSIAQFAAFSASFGLALSGISALGSSGSSIAMFLPILEQGEPILKAVPEMANGKKRISALGGRIELNQISFRYQDDGPDILHDLNLKIDAGEYIAIVGKTGCGKSTLMRLLLGFETPRQGAVLYDGEDLENIDKHSLRRNIGTVLQNGKLFPGDIYSNIIISRPSATLDDVWEAAEKAGIAEDIRRMPMGMNTFIPEGGGGVSGGQKQRLLIARAICGNPKVIMFDEATSALDNLTQRIVTDSLNAMKCTRIVIAHRLSTIRECDRIIVLDHGTIREDGSYDELLANQGLFAELVERQMMDQE